MFPPKMKIAIDFPIHPPGLEAVKAQDNIEIDCFEAPPPVVGKVLTRILDPARAGDADVLFCSFPPANLAELKKLKWIQIPSVGYAQVVGLGLSERGISASNARGALDSPIAEWNVAMMVNLARDLRQMIRNQDAAVWDNAAPFQREIRGMTVGLWGYGGIGRDTARLARQLGMRVHVMTRNGVRPRQDTYVVPGVGDPEGVLPHHVFRSGEETAFLGSLDFLILSLPLTSVTEGMIGERELQALPRTAYLLNPARAAIVKEAALLRALREKWIAGAAIDTHYQYPLPAQHPLWSVPNLILTPHISGSGISAQYKERLWDLFAQNVRRFLNGDKLLNQLTADELAGK